MSAPIVSFQADPSDNIVSGQNNNNNKSGNNSATNMDSIFTDRRGSMFDASTAFAPSATSLRNYSQPMKLTHSESGKTALISFEWNTHQDSIYCDLIEEIQKALGMPVDRNTTSVALNATIKTPDENGKITDQEETFPIIGDSQLRTILLTLSKTSDQKFREANPVKISVGTRRRSMGSVLSKAITVTVISGLSGDSFGEAGEFRFRFVAGNDGLLTDFKCECMDALDMFGTDADSFDIHLNSKPILSTHALEKELNELLKQNAGAQVKLVPGSQTLVSQASPNDSGRADKAATIVDPDSIFEPSITSLRGTAKNMTVSNGITGKTAEITFAWNTHEDNIFHDLCEQIGKAVDVMIDRTEAMQLVATVDGESFVIFGDNQLRNMLISIGNKPLKISTSARRRSMGSVLSKAVPISCLSGLSGEAHGETGVFRFRFVPGNDDLLNDFKLECSDALDLFGTDASTFDILLKKNGEYNTPITKSHQLEQVLTAALGNINGAAAPSTLEVKLVPASQNLFATSTTDSAHESVNRSAVVVDPQAIFEPSITSLRGAEKTMTVTNGETGKTAEIVFAWTTHDDNIFQELCNKIIAAVDAKVSKTEAMQLTATVDGESFIISGDNQLRNMLISIGNKPLKISTSTRRRSIGSVLARAVMCSCLNLLEEHPENPSATFRFRFLPDDAEALTNFKCEVMDALDLFGTDENSFDVEIKRPQDSSWTALPSSDLLREILNGILAHNDTAMIIPFRIVPATTNPKKKKSNSPTRIEKIQVAYEHSSQFDQAEIETDWNDENFMQSLTNAAAGAFELGTDTALRLFGISDEGERIEIVDDDSARAAVAEKLRIIAVAAAEKAHHDAKQQHHDQKTREIVHAPEPAKPKEIKLAVTLVQFTATPSSLPATAATSDGDGTASSSTAASSSVGGGDIPKQINFDYEVITLAGNSSQNGSLHELRKAVAKHLELDLFAGDSLELYFEQQEQQKGEGETTTATQTVELESDKQLSTLAEAREKSATLTLKYKASLHPSRRNRYITVKATELQKKGVDYVEVVDSVYEFSPIKPNPNMINELRALVYRSLKPSVIALRNVKMTEVNDEKAPYSLEAQLDGEWVAVNGNRAALAMFRALTENSAGFVSLRIKPPTPPPQDWEIAITVFYHGNVFRHETSFVQGSTANYNILFTELKKVCNVPFDKLDTVSLDHALPATRADRTIRDDKSLTQIFKELIHEAASPETYRRKVVLRIEDTISAATVNAERSESDKRKVKSVFYTASFQGASSIHPQDGRVDIDLNKKRGTILSDLRDLLLDNLRVPRLGGSTDADIAMYMALKQQKHQNHHHHQHMMNDQQLIDFLSLVGDDNSAENRLEIIFRSSAAPTSGKTLNNNKTSFPVSSSPNNRANNNNNNNGGVQISRQELIQDIANCWIELAGGSANGVNMEDVRITFTTWTDGKQLDPQQTCLKRFNEVSSWCGEVSSAEIINILRDLVSHLSDYALSNFRMHARDMANFCEGVSSSSKSNRLFATSFRAYASDAAVSREFLLTGLVDSDITTKEKAESVLSAYGENLSEEDFCEVLAYFVGDDSLALHKVLSAATPTRPQWVGSPRKDDEVLHRQETRLRIELRHVMDYQYPETLVNFFKNFSDIVVAVEANKARSIESSGTNNAAQSKQQQQALAARGVAWCLAVLLQHPSANIDTAIAQNSNNNVDEIQTHDGAWNWLKAFVRNEESAENFLTLLRTTETVPVSRNTLALVASRLLSRDVERGNLLAISSSIASLGQWCTLVCQLSCLTRDISWPPEFIPSQPDFEKLSMRSPRSRKTVEKNIAASPPRQTEAFVLTGGSPNSNNSRRPGTSSGRETLAIEDNSQQQQTSRAIVAIAPSPPTSPPASNSARKPQNNNNNSGNRFVPRYNATSSFGLESNALFMNTSTKPSKNDTTNSSSARSIGSNKETEDVGKRSRDAQDDNRLAEVMRSAALTRNAAAGAVMQTKLGATHLLFTISSASGLQASNAGKFYVAVFDASPQSENNGKEIFRTPVVAGATNFPVNSSRFLAGISGPNMAFVFKLMAATGDRFVSACRWTISKNPATSNNDASEFNEEFVNLSEGQSLALKLTSSEDGRGAAGAGHLAVMVTRQKELAYIPKDIRDAMLEITFGGVAKASTAKEENNKKKNKAENASSDSDEDPALAAASGKQTEKDNSFIQAVNTMGDIVFTLGNFSQNKTVVIDLERALPYLTLQRVNPQVAGGDDVTDTVDISATKFIASRHIEESLKPVIKLTPGCEDSINVIRSGPPLVLKLTSIGFQVVVPEPKDEPVAPTTRALDNAAAPVAQKQDPAEEL